MPVVPLEVSTEDAAVIALLAGPQGLVPGAMHSVHSGALLVYEGPVAGSGPMPAYAFRLDFGTPNVAAAAANWLWSKLHGHTAELSVGGEEVPLHHGAIKAALLVAAGEPLTV